MRDSPRVMSRMPLPLRFQGNDACQHTRTTALIAVINDELAVAHLAQLLLFSVGSCAILFDVPSGTSQIGESWGLHDASLTYPSLFFFQY
jgi:hypothetical protein